MNILKLMHNLDPSIWTTLSARGSARGSTEPSIKPRRRNSILRDLASELGIMKSADIKQFVVQLNLQTETDTDFTSTSNFYTTSIARLSTLSQYFLRILSTFMRWFRFPNVWMSNYLKFLSFKNCLIHLNKIQAWFNISFWRLLKFCCNILPRHRSTWVR